MRKQHLLPSLRMGQWFSQQRELEMKLDDAKYLNKNLLSLKREQERVMVSNRDTVRLKLLRDEVSLLKSLVREARRLFKENEKCFKKTQEHIEKLKQRH